MTVHVAATSVRTSVVVEAPIERAFKTFTEDMGSWWDADHHLVDGFERMEVQLHEGGRIIDHGRDGTTCSWARVLAYEPPSRFAFSWDIAPNWQIETDARRASEVEVRFTSEGPDRTRVDLEHKHLDRHGEGWESMRDA
ncbi:MAG: Activator of Hsp90 ATPase 1 family protein, partial [Solirubrobacterales bacterium]|nr:Activator of Hsp90 ATPase 1 family protein [Solirubrobacterales bacterium]